jgi:hypothetical protein
MRLPGELAETAQYGRSFSRKRTAMERAACFEPEQAGFMGFSARHSTDQPIYTRLEPPWSAQPRVQHTTFHCLVCKSGNDSS